MDNVPWEIPAVLNTFGDCKRDTTFRGAVEAYRDLPESDRNNAEIFFLLENLEGRLQGQQIDKYVAMLD